MIFNIPVPWKPDAQKGVILQCGRAGHQHTRKIHGSWNNPSLLQLLRLSDIKQLNVSTCKQLQQFWCVYVCPLEILNLIGTEAAGLLQCRLAGGGGEQETVIPSSRAQIAVVEYGTGWEAFLQM